MASLARPCAAKRLSPDHQALLRVSGEKSDMGHFLLFVVVGCFPALAAAVNTGNQAEWQGSTHKNASD